MTSIRLGDLLVKAKVISESQLRASLAEQQKWGGKLGEILVRMSFLTEDMLVKALSKQLSIPTVNLEEVPTVPPHVKGKVPVEVARDLVALPLMLKDDGKTLVVAMAEPQNLKHVDTLRAVSRLRIQPQIAGRQAIARAFSRFYGSDSPEVGSASGHFKVVDVQGNTVIKEGAPAPEARPSGSEGLPTSQLGRSPRELLEALSEAQTREVGVLKGLVALLIEKGIFTREEYLAKVRR